MLLVSVIIPCYNSHEYLQEAIASMQQQTYTNIEIIVVDDGSTNTQTIATFAQLPDNITILRKPNGGLASARNFGIAHSNGNIIITLDSDDKFAISFVKKAIAILEKRPTVGVVSSYVKEFGARAKIWRTSAVDDLSFLVENRVVACCAFRKQCWEEVGGYDETMRWGCEDWEFWIRVTQKGWKVHIIPKPLFFYRKHASSMLANETIPKMDVIVDYMITKHHDWFMSRLKKAIVEKTLVNKKTLTLRRIMGLVLEKIRGEF